MVGTGCSRETYNEIFNLSYPDSLLLSTIDIGNLATLKTYALYFLFLLSTPSEEYNRYRFCDEYYFEIADKGHR